MLRTLGRLSCGLCCNCVNLQAFCELLPVNGAQMQWFLASGHVIEFTAKHFGISSAEVSTILNSCGFDTQYFNME